MENWGGFLAFRGNQNYWRSLSIVTRLFWTPCFFPRLFCRFSSFCTHLTSRSLIPSVLLGWKWHPVWRVSVALHLKPLLLLFDTPWARNVSPCDWALHLRQPWPQAVSWAFLLFQGLRNHNSFKTVLDIYAAYCDLLQWSVVEEDSKPQQNSSHFIPLILRYLIPPVLLKPFVFTADTV